MHVHLGIRLAAKLVGLLTRTAQTMPSAAVVVGTAHEVRGLERGNVGAARWSVSG